MSDAAILGQLFLQGRHFRAKDHLPGSEDPGQGLLDLLLQMLVLGLQIAERNPCRVRRIHVPPPFRRMGHPGDLCASVRNEPTKLCRKWEGVKIAFRLRAIREDGEAAASILSMIR